MELIVISSPDTVKEEIHLVNRLFEAGLQVFHLRKTATEPTVYQKILDGIRPAYHHKIALHHFHWLARDYDIKRIHHTENFRKNSTAADFHNDCIFSTSIHQTEDMALLKPYHYSFFGPVFNSISKPGYLGITTPNFNVSNPGKAKLFALGGIGLNNLKQVKEMNFDGAALLGSIWNEPEKALANFKKIQSKCQQLQNIHP